MPWPKGKLKTKEFKERVSQTLLRQRGVANKDCAYCGQPFKPKYPAQIYCNRTCANRANPPPKDTPIRQCMASDARERNRLSHIGLRYPPEVNKKKGRSRPGWKHTEETRRLMSELAKSKERLARLRHRNSSPEFQKKRLAACRKGPNRLEKKLERILNDSFLSQWKFVGDGQVILGGLNPDFINIDGRKQVIELFGDYWHNSGFPLRTEQERASIFKEYGYRQLVIWEHELKEHAEIAIVGKIREFMFEEE